MKYRRFGRTDWSVSEIGYGMWGMAGWTGSDDDLSKSSLQEAVDLGVNFFDTAWAYGNGKSENLLGELLAANPNKQLYTASKIPPKNFKWPSRRAYTLDDCFPPDHIEKYIHKSLENMGTQSMDLIQFHTWEDAWIEDDRWIRKMDDLKSQGLIRAVGISINRWEPWNGVKSVKSGHVDAVQAIYNIFDQNPDDELLPACQAHDVAFIARVPFDEGTLTGNITLDSRWPEDDWRSTYFVDENLKSCVAKADELRPFVTPEMSMAEMALRFILAENRVSTVIPGMRKLAHVRANAATSESGPLAPELMAELKGHRWDREPTAWSQ